MQADLSHVGSHVRGEGGIILVFDKKQLKRVLIFGILD